MTPKCKPKKPHVCETHSHDRNACPRCGSIYREGKLLNEAIIEYELKVAYWDNMFFALGCSIVSIFLGFHIGHTIMSSAIITKALQSERERAIYAETDGNLWRSKSQDAWRALHGHINTAGAQKAWEVLDQ